jgi:hypothetical protein
MKSWIAEALYDAGVSKGLLTRLCAEDDAADDLRDILNRPEDIGTDFKCPSPDGGDPV